MDHSILPLEIMQLVYEQADGLTRNMLHLTSRHFPTRINGRVGRVLVTSVCALEGHVFLFADLLKRNFKRDEKNLLLLAVRGGNPMMVDCLLFARVAIPSPRDAVDAALEIAINSTRISAPSEVDNLILNMLRRAFHERKVPFTVSDSGLKKISANGEIELLDYFIRHCGTTIIYRCSDYIPEALQHGRWQFFQHLEKLILEHQSHTGYHMHPDFFCSLISEKSLQFLEVILQSRLLYLWEWPDAKNKQILFAVLERGDLDILNLFHKQGLKLVAEAFLHTKGNQEVWDWLISKKCPVSAYVAISTGSMQLLDLVYTRNIPLSKEAFTEAVKSFNQATIASLYEHQCPIDNQKVMFYAGLKGCLEFLSFLFDCGCTLTADITAGAAMGGHLEFLKCMLVSGVALHNYAPFLAASNERIDVLDFLLSQKERRLFAQKKTWITFNGSYHLEVVEGKMVNYAFSKGNIALYQWLLPYS